MNLKIRLQIEKLRELLENFNEDTLEQLRDESLLLADHIEEYVYQRDAQRIVEEFIEETKKTIEDV
jgi:DNA polymerase II large subunit